MAAPQSPAVTASESDEPKNNQTIVPVASSQQESRSSSLNSSIVVVVGHNSTESNSDDSGGAVLLRAPHQPNRDESFEPVQRVSARISDLPTPLASPVLVREFAAANQAAVANLVPKPPRHSLERGAKLTTNTTSASSGNVVYDDGAAADREIVALLPDIDVEESIPMPPTSPMPKTSSGHDMSIVFAKTNVGNF